MLSVETVTIVANTCLNAQTRHPEMNKFIKVFTCNEFANWFRANTFLISERKANWFWYWNLHIHRGFLLGPSQGPEREVRDGRYVNCANSSIGQCQALWDHFDLLILLPDREFGDFPIWVYDSISRLEFRSAGGLQEPPVAASIQRLSGTFLHRSLS